MWCNVTDKLPTSKGVFKVYGLVNIGSMYENECKFDAFWHGNAWGDREGEDLTDMYLGISHWYDFNDVADPI